MPFPDDVLCPQKTLSLLHIIKLILSPSRAHMEVE